MGLLEEAISEFQKVAKATDRGRAFRYTMQCCTLLDLPSWKRETGRRSDLVRPCAAHSGPRPEVSSHCGMIWV